MPAQSQSYETFLSDASTLDILDLLAIQLRALAVAPVPAMLCDVDSFDDSSSLMSFVIGIQSFIKVCPESIP
ncbi:hypothetical protein KCU88_g156, partial [Aureobasidium melanogenum]